MADAPLRPGARYQLKHTTRRVRATVESIDSEVDVSRLRDGRAAAELQLNDIGRVHLDLATPLMAEPYTTQPRHRRVHPDRREVTRHGRGRHGARGLRGSGPADRPAQPGRDLARARAAAAPALEPARPARRHRVADRPARVGQVDDRRGARAPAGRARPARLPARRRERAPRAQRRPRLLPRRPVRARAPRRQRRAHVRRRRRSSRSSRSSPPPPPTAQWARQLHDEAGLEFVEAWVDTPLDECERRDPHGLYARARAGRLRGFTGVDAPYEPPMAADVRLRGAEESVEQSVERLISALP